MGDLTTLADVAARLEQEPGQGALIADTDGAEIGRLITAISVEVETIASREFTLRTHDETYDGRGGTRLQLRHWPITAVASVIVGATAVPAGSSVRAGWYHDERRVLLTGYRFARGAANVRVVYDAGFATAPADLRRAVTEIVAVRYRERPHTGISSQTSVQQTTNYIAQDLPADVLRVVHGYSRVTPV